jgi:hypothetical protein
MVAEPPPVRARRLRARLAAVAALGLLVLAAIPFLVVAVNVVDGLVVLGCLFLGTYCGWLSIVRPGPLLLLTVLGEAVRMAAPLRFESRPAALRVRLPPAAGGVPRPPRQWACPGATCAG